MHKRSSLLIKLNSQFIVAIFIFLLSLVSPGKLLAQAGTYDCSFNTFTSECQVVNPSCNTGYAIPPNACPGNDVSNCNRTNVPCQPSASGSDIFGRVNAPPGVSAYPASGGLSVFVGNILKILIVIAGIYTLFNFVFAGYMFLSAGDDSKKIQGAWGKIYQSAIGLAVAASAFVLAGVFGQLIFGSPNALLQIRVFGP